MGIRNTLCIRPGRTDRHDQSADRSHNDSAEVLLDDGQNVALLDDDILHILQSDLGAGVLVGDDLVTGLDASW